MNLPETEQDFLRELVKHSRQRSHHVRWTDRDGTERITTLGQADVVRVNRLAQQLGRPRLPERGHSPKQQSLRR